MGWTAPFNPYEGQGTYHGSGPSRAVLRSQAKLAKLKREKAKAKRESDRKYKNKPGSNNPRDSKRPPSK